MNRNDSQNFGLKGTNDHRASLKDLNAVRPSNYLSSFLERVTDDVKIPKAHVKAIQEENEFYSSNYDGFSSVQMASQIFGSKRGSKDLQAGSSKVGFFPNITKSERDSSMHLVGNASFVNSPPVDSSLKPSNFHRKR